MQKSGPVPKIACPSATRRSASSGAWACWTIQSRRAPLVQLDAGRRPSARTPATCVRTRPTGAISVPNVRIGLTFSAAAEHRLSGADPAAAAQVLERVQAEPDVEALARLGDGLDHPSRLAPSAAACGGGEHEAPEAAGAGLPVDHLHATAMAILGQQPRRLARALAGARQAAGDVDRERRPARRARAARSTRGSHRPRAARSSAAAASHAAGRRTRRGRRTRARGAAPRPSRRTGPPADPPALDQRRGR